MPGWIARNWRRVVVDSWDAAFAAVVGGVLAILGATGKVSAAGLAQWTLAVLSLLAFALIRERFARVDTLEAIKRDLARTVGELRDAAPYRILESESTWDFETADGSVATSTISAILEFSHDRCLTIPNWLQADGKIENESFRAGPTSRKMMPLTVVDEIRSKGGSYRVLYLGRFYNRGQTMHMEHTRTLRDSFPATNEGISVQAESPVEQQRITIIWPEARPPQTLTLKRASGDQRVPLTELRTVDGRKTYSVVEPLGTGELLEVEWDW